MAQQSSGEKQAGRKRVQVVRVQMVKERSVNFATNKVCRPEDAAHILADFVAGADREHFVVMCLDQKNQVNAINVAAVGILNASLVHPREVVQTSDFIQRGNGGPLPGAAAPRGPVGLAGGQRCVPGGAGNRKRNSWNGRGTYLGTPRACS